VAFTTRDFQPEDLETLWRIDQACFPRGISYSRQELKLYLRRPRSFALVATDDGAAEDSNARNKTRPAEAAPDTIAGFIVAEAGSRGTGHVITIDVVVKARRSGAGSLLLRSAEERLRAENCHSVALETAVDNLAALAFYKRHGYSVTRTFPRYYSNGVDALVLSKSLQQKDGGSGEA